MSYDYVTPAGAPADSIVRIGNERVRALDIGAPAVSGQLASMGGLLMGWSLRETSGAASASADLWDGSGPGAKRVGAINLNAHTESQRTMFPTGVDVTSGLYLQVVSGAMTGAVYYQVDMDPS